MVLSRDLPRWRHLITAEWLAALTAGESVDAAPCGEWRLLEVGCDGWETFREGHINGASYLDTHQLERGPMWNKVPDAELLELLLANGIRHDTCVLVYGRSNLAAARAAHLLLYAGVQDVRLLDGGYAAWQAGSHPVDTEMALFSPVNDFGATFPGNPEYLIDMDQARQLLQRDDAALVSIRTWNEFIGACSGYPYITAKGDIPGARWGGAGEGNDVNSMSHFHRPDGTMKPAAEIAAFWHRAGVHPDRWTSFYCGTGWRASLAFFYAWLMKWNRISVYDGGWCEWSSDAGNDVIRRVAIGSGALACPT